MISSVGAMVRYLGVEPSVNGVDQLCVVSCIQNLAALGNFAIFNMNLGRAHNQFMQPRHGLTVNVGTYAVYAESGVVGLRSARGGPNGR